MGELIVNAIKFGLIIMIATTFFVAITSIINLVTSLVFGGVVSEIVAIISCCLPFSASAVFGAYVPIFAAILSFMVAKKVWALTVTAEDAT